MSEEMSDSLVRRLSEHDRAFIRTIEQLQKDLEVETSRVDRLREDVAKLKRKNRTLKRVIRMHHEMLSTIANEHLASASLDGGSSSDSEQTLSEIYNRTHL